MTRVLSSDAIHALFEACDAGSGVTTCGRSWVSCSSFRDSMNMMNPFETTNHRVYNDIIGISMEFYGYMPSVSSSAQNRSCNVLWKTIGRPGLVTRFPLGSRSSVARASEVMYGEWRICSRLRCPGLWAAPSSDYPIAAVPLPLVRRWIPSKKLLRRIRLLWSLVCLTNFLVCWDFNASTEGPLSLLECLVLQAWMLPSVRGFLLNPGTARNCIPQQRNSKDDQ